MRCLSLTLLVLVACSDSEPPTSRSVPSYLAKPVYEPPLIEYKIPKGIPIELATPYADFQELLTEKRWQFFLMQVKTFCDGYMTPSLLELRIRLWFPELHNDNRNALVYTRLPKYNRSLDGRKAAIFALANRGDKQIGADDIANDVRLSKANLMLSGPEAWYNEHIQGRIYDCVEGY